MIHAGTAGIVVDFAGALVGDPLGIPIRSGGSGGTATATADGFTDAEYRATVLDSRL